MYRPKVVIVEDQDKMAEMFADTLYITGYQAKHIRDGREAINFFEINTDEDIFLIMLDINLPSVAGHDIYEKIRAMPRYEQVPIIMSTANTYMANKVQLTLREGDYLFIKPLNLYELQRVAKLHKPSTGKLQELADNIAGKEENQQTTSSPNAENKTTKTEN